MLEDCYCTVCSYLDFMDNSPQKPQCKTKHGSYLKSWLSRTVTVQLGCGGCSWGWGTSLGYSVRAKLEKEGHLQKGTGSPRSTSESSKWHPHKDNLRQALQGAWEAGIRQRQRRAWRGARVSEEGILAEAAEGGGQGGNCSPSREIKALTHRVNKSQQRPKQVMH